MTATKDQIRAAIGRGISEMILKHYSKSLLQQIRSMEQNKIGPKPNGLWFSVEGEDDWVSWCNAEDFRLENLACVTELKLTENAKVLHIGSIQEIDSFTRLYKEHESYCIDWCRVAKKYQGIIIAPYQWKRRLEGGAYWYYGWDCASGCVWDAGAVRVV